MPGNSAIREQRREQLRRIVNEDASFAPPLRAAPTCQVGGLLDAPRPAFSLFDPALFHVLSNVIQLRHVFNT